MTDIGVIGAGVMGYNHIRVLSRLKGANLVAISDPSGAALDKAAAEFEVPAKHLSYRDMIKMHDLDAAVIAAPNHLHKEISIYCMKRGIDVLVEKPISHSINDAVRMGRVARKYGRVLMVGHIERFNPVVTKIKELIGKGRLGPIYLVNTVRAGPYPKRLRNIGVLIDLAVHDVDIIRYLASDIRRIYSQLIMSNGQAIYCKSLFTLSNNARGSCEFSWVSPKRARTISIYGANGILEGNYQEQTLKFYDNPDARDMPKTYDYHRQILLMGKISSGKMAEYKIRKEEPLKLELRHFMECVKSRKKPLISPEDAIKAVEIALLMLKSGTKGKSVLVK